MKRLFVGGLVYLLAVSLPIFAAIGAPLNYIGTQDPGFVGYATDRIVVNFSPSAASTLTTDGLTEGGLTNNAILNNLAKRFGVRSFVRQFPHVQKRQFRGRTIDLSGWHKVVFDRAVDIQAVIQAYRAVPGVTEVQPVGIHKIDADYRDPNDPEYIQQWHLDQIGAPYAWTKETGNTDIIVAILDTGVRYFAKDLGGLNASYDNPQAAEGNMFINWAEKNGTAGVDDDPPPDPDDLSKVFIDDWIGWDFVQSTSSSWLYQCSSGEDCSVADNDPRDFNGHGTHCAGIVAAINNNELGVASIAGGWGTNPEGTVGNGVKIMPLRIGWSSRYFFYNEVGLVSMDYAAQALIYAADHGAKIASCSWGSSDTGGLRAAIDYFLSKGGIIVKSAGNNNNETADFMGLRDDVIKVAATDSSDCRASFSSYGSWVDISAPGVGIWSLYNNHDTATDAVASMSGTSMATPLVAGVAALIWSRNPTWDAERVKQQLLETADPIDTLSCNSAYAGKLGTGRVNALAAVNTGPEELTADFAFSPTTACVGSEVTFTDKSEPADTIVSWYWDFADTTTYDQQSPAPHTYQTKGDYLVSLTVTDQDNQESSVEKTITVIGLPNADFIVDQNSGYAPLTVKFTDKSTGEPIPSAWSWDFDKDGNIDSTSQNPTYTYEKEGTYTVSLGVSNGCKSTSKTMTITVNPPPGPPAADFSFSFPQECKPTVQFTDASEKSDSDAAITSWSWDFGDSSQVSADQSPTHTYATGGTYKVSLTVKDDNNQQSTIQQEVVVNVAPTAKFEASSTEGTAPLTVKFTDGSEGNPTSWSWDFNNDNIPDSTEQSPTYTYAAGQYTASLTVSNQQCGSDTISVDITASEPAQNVLRIEKIQVSTSSFWFFRRATARVWITDASGNPIQGATVSGSWSGSVSGSANITTGADGSGSVSSSYIYSSSPTFTFTVNSVSKTDWTYDPSQNVVNPPSVTAH